MDLSEAAEAVVAAGAPAAVALRRSGDETEIAVAGDARADSRFRIGSVTKTYTAALCLLADIPLDVPVGELVADLPEVCRIPTLRQLLMHRSGLFDHVWDGERGSELLFDFESRPDPRRDIEIVGGYPLAFEPGTAFRYSNTNLQLAGLALEAGTGASYRVLLERLICAPLALGSTTFCPEPRTEPGLVHGFALPGGLAPTPGDEPADATTALHGSWADGAIVANARDVGAFFAALLRGTLLAAGPQHELLRAEPTDDGRLAGLGILGRELAAGVLAWGHGGYLPGYLSRVHASADGDRVAVVLANGQSQHVHHALERAASDVFHPQPS
jgi:D-alanyl-D-alanine carboxypeptidase